MQGINIASVPGRVSQTLVQSVGICYGLICCLPACLPASAADQSINPMVVDTNGSSCVIARCLLI